MEHEASNGSAGVALRDRLLTLSERTHDGALERLAHGQLPAEEAAPTQQVCSDWINTSLMDAYKRTGDNEVFALLYELNHDSFRAAIKGLMSRFRTCVDADDVLQETFLNICRYPHNFVADEAKAFRSWAHRIVRNTFWRTISAVSRQPRPLLIDEEHPEPEDRSQRRPDRVVVEHEAAAVVNDAYVLFLSLYLSHFSRLPSQGQRLLTLAEIEGRPYASIAAELRVPVDRIKVSVFRARRRIMRGMQESLAALERAGEISAKENGEP
jgi:RNA polymerase sigma factor (sigma-70 family)